MIGVLDDLGRPFTPHGAEPPPGAGQRARRPLPPAIYDPTAERAVAGVAVATGFGAELAAATIPGLAGGVEAHHFHDPRLGAVFAAALQLPDGLRRDTDGRVDYLAGIGGEDWAWLTDLVNDRPCMHDRSRSFARRVVRAHAHRTTAHQLVRRLEQYGLDIDIRTVT